MKLTITLLTILITSQLFAQFGGTYSAEVLTSRFLKTKTYIVLTGDKHFDENLAAGFKEFWTITEYEFIESEDKIDIKDQSVSYVIPIKMTVTDNYSTQEYFRYGLVMGGNEPFLTRNLADIILDNFGYEKRATEAAYRAFGIPKMMQDFIQMRIDGEPISGNTITMVRYKTGLIYNQKTTKVKAKTLLIDSRQLISGPYYPYPNKKSFSELTFSSTYDGKVKFVSTNELEEAINERNPNYTYMLAINERKKYLLVVDCESGSVWYNGYQPRGIGVTKKDVKLLSKSVNGKTVIKLN